MPDPFIIMCAPNGARKSKEDHAKLPITPSELSRCAEEILEAGASILHLHVRDKNGRHSLSADSYRAAIKAVRKTVGDKLLIQVTTEAVGIYSRQEQIELIKELRPEAVSVGLREICPTDAEVLETEALFTWMRREAIFPQIILYDENDRQRFEAMRRDGVFSQNKPFVLAVLGRHGKDSQEPIAALHDFAKSFTASDTPWAACGFGLTETTLPARCAELDGHVRVGFENNLWLADGEQAANNASLVSHAHTAVSALGRNIASADDIRQMFSLKA
ncbi:MAG: 3-keto-5-aminohexanoate cleavage protein [Kordiimonadaceae bacterium]|nr:3-keto-5-aminohexanoate cleavage protein [Kordiimonadaceae bacterium]